MEKKPSKLLSQQDKPRKFKGRRAKFIEKMADPSVKTQAEAAIAAGYSENGAHQAASRLLTNVEIREAIEQRRARAAEITGATPEFIIGSAIRQATSTIDDALDEHGHFSIQKARETGVIDLIKSITRSPNKYGETVRFEMYDAAAARQELADYIGLKQKPRENEEKLKEVAELVRHYMEDFPQADTDRVIKMFARGSGLPVEQLVQEFGGVQ